VQKRRPFDVHLSRVVASGLHFGQLESDIKLVSFFSKCQFSTTLEIGVGRGGDEVAVWNLLLFPVFFLQRLGLVNYICSSGQTLFVLLAESLSFF